MRVIGIETSCDDTAIAAYQGDEHKLLCSLVETLPATHADFGGIVPELASRDHSKSILNVFSKLLKKVNWSIDMIEAIAYTKGPGLAGSLLVGCGFAKTLGLSLSIPTIGVHHIEGHIAAPFLCNPDTFPCVALLVSGGHTQLYLINGWFDYQLIGQSRDDAAGEAFDKCAKLLGLGYPGGRALAELAKEGDASHFNLPRPMKNEGLDFSFSGLKTAVLYKIRELEENNQLDRQTRCDMAASVEQSIIDLLTCKAVRAMQQTSVHKLIVSGGVSANELLRESIQQHCRDVCYPELEYCTDNGAMIALAGYKRLKAGYADNDLAITPSPRWVL